MNCNELQEHARADCFLVKKPRALQWFYKGELQKEKEEERQAGRFELFLDLLYVAIVANLAMSSLNILTELIWQSTYSSLRRPGISGPIFAKS
jgi:hypothetical protein